MNDRYLKAADEAAMNAILLAAGLIVEQTVRIQTGEDEDGNPVIEDATALVPAPGVSIDVIGPITRQTGTDENGDPVFTTYSEHHVNIRAAYISEEAEALLEPIKIVPPETPFRVWAR